MDWELLLQRLFDAMFNAAIYSSLALALVIIYRSTGLLNFAQGELATFAAFVAFLFFNGKVPGLTGGELAASFPGVPWPIWLAVMAAVLFGMAAGAVTERVLMRPLEGAPDLAVVNVTIGLLIAVNAASREWWGTGGRFFPAMFPSEGDDFLGVGGARLRYTTIGAWLTLAVLVGLLGLLVQKTKAGLAFQAVSISRESAELNGIRVGRTLMFGWALAAGMGAVAATMSANVVLLDANMMLRVLVFAFAAATLGGLDSPKGAIVGGIIIGLTQTLVPAYVPGIGFELSLLPPLLIMVLVLLVRPQGLFGTRPVERV